MPRGSGGYHNGSDVWPGEYTVSAHVYRSVDGRFPTPAREGLRARP